MKSSQHALSPLGTPHKSKQVVSSLQGPQTPSHVEPSPLGILQQSKQVVSSLQGPQTPSPVSYTHLTLPTKA